jgi:general secretion pathway protein C
MNAASFLEGLPPRDRWRALLLAEGPRVATWVLALALGVQAAFIVTDLAGSARGTRTGAAPPGLRAPARLLNPGAIASAHLFGTAPVPKQDDENAPASSVPLVLTGIIAGNDPQSGLAILGPNAQSAKVHAVGDAVASGVKLHSVYSDRVIIDRNGQLESLMLPRQVSGAAPAPSTAALPMQSPVFDRMRRVFTEQPGLLADLLRPQAVLEGDKVKGFRVYPGRNRVAFARLGLRPGDEVIAVNGAPLDDQDRGQAILNTLGSSSEARVTVIRNNQQQDLTLNVAQVAQEAEAGLQSGPFGGVAGSTAPTPFTPPAGSTGPSPFGPGPAVPQQPSAPAAQAVEPVMTPPFVPPAPPPEDPPPGTTPPQDGQ